MSELKPCPVCGATLKIYSPEDWKPSYCNPHNAGDPYSADCDCGFRYSNGSYDCAEFVAALNRRAQSTNEPLTLDELRGMDGEPIYIVEIGLEHNNRWEILDRDCPVDADLEDVNLCNGDCYAAYNMGIAWLAYRRKPELEGGDR